MIRDIIGIQIMKGKAVIMTREECISIISETNQKRDLYQFVLFYRSPVSNEVEHRIIYTPQYEEGLGWLGDILGFYKEREIPFAAYSCGGIYDFQGILFPY